MIATKVKNLILIGFLSINSFTTVFATVTVDKHFKCDSLFEREANSKAKVSLEKTKIENQFDALNINVKTAILEMNTLLSDSKIPIVQIDQNFIDWYGITVHPFLSTLLAENNIFNIGDYKIELSNYSLKINDKESYVVSLFLNNSPNSNELRERFLSIMRPYVNKNYTPKFSVPIKELSNSDSNSENSSESTLESNSEKENKPAFVSRPVVGSASGFVSRSMVESTPTNVNSTRLGTINLERQLEKQLQNNYKFHDPQLVDNNHPEVIVNSNKLLKNEPNISALEKTYLLLQWFKYLRPRFSQCKSGNCNNINDINKYSDLLGDIELQYQVNWNQWVTISKNGIHSSNNPKASIQNDLELVNASWLSFFKSKDAEAIQVVDQLIEYFDDYFVKNPVELKLQNQWLKYIFQEKVKDIKSIYMPRPFFEKILARLSDPILADAMKDENLWYFWVKTSLEYKSY